MKFQKLIVIGIFFMFNFNVFADETLFVGEKECSHIVIKNKLIDKDAKVVWEKQDDENSPLELPTKILKNENKLFILSQPNTLLVYDTNGEYENEYYAKGKGPGEFLLLKDFSIEEDFIFCLDKDKRCISKFTTDFILLWEKKISNELSNISPENIAVSNGNIYISGFIVTPNKEEGNYLVYKMDQNLEVVDKFFKLEETFYKKTNIFNKKKKYFENILKTSNVIDVKDSLIIMGMTSGENILYGYDMKNDKFYFKVIDKINKGKYKVKKRLFGYEIKAYYYTIGLQITKNYIITSESAGDLHYFKDKEL